MAGASSNKAEIDWVAGLLQAASNSRESKNGIDRIGYGKLMNVPKVAFSLETFQNKKSDPISGVAFGYCHRVLPSLSLK